jgi:tetratricopeptide (TPR) repeat protein
VFQHALGITYAVDRQYENAKVALRTALALAPHCPDTVNALARVLIDSGASDEAIDLLESNVEEFSGNDESRDLLARAYSAKGRHQLAQYQLKQLLNNSTRLSLGQRVRTLNTLAESYMHSGKPKEAELALKRAINIGPEESVVPYDNLGRLYIYHFERLDDALAILTAGLKLFPSRQSTGVLLAITYAANGDPDKAIAQLEPFWIAGAAIEDCYVCLGWLYGEHGNVAGAIRVLTEGLDRFPDSKPIVNNLAYTYLMDGQVENAGVILDPLPDTSLLHPELIATYGLLALWRGDYVEGERLYERAEEAATRSGDDYKRKRAGQKKHLELARFWKRNGDFARARNEIRSGLAVRDYPLSFKSELEELAEDLSLE